MASSPETDGPIRSRKSEIHEKFAFPENPSLMKIRVFVKFQFLRKSEYFFVKF